VEAPLGVFAVLLDLIDALLELGGLGAELADPLVQALLSLADPFLHVATRLALQLIPNRIQLLPQLRKAGGARIVVVSSRAGAMNEGMSGGHMAYRISKAAVNAFVCNLSAELAPDRILVNAMHPGWVRTDMGGRSAAVAPEDAADTVLFLATLADDGPTGKFWFERRQIDF